SLTLILARKNSTIKLPSSKGGSFLTLTKSRIDFKNWLYNICWGCPTIFMQKNTRIYPILLYLNCRETSREMEMRVYGFKLSFSRLKGWVGKNVKEVR